MCRCRQANAMSVAHQAPSEAPYASKARSETGTVSITVAIKDSIWRILFPYNLLLQKRRRVLPRWIAHEAARSQGKMWPFVRASQQFLISVLRAEMVKRRAVNEAMPHCAIRSTQLTSTSVAHARVEQPCLGPLTVCHYRLQISLLQSCQMRPATSAGNGLRQGLCEGLWTNH